MDQILLCSNHIPLTTSINNSFIQKYMLDANGSYVKVYLYLSMCIQSGRKNLSISSLADMMDNTEKDILRALRYWEKNDLMVLQKDTANSAITGIEIVNPDILETEQPQAKAETAADVPEIPPKTAGADDKGPIPASPAVSRKDSPKITVTEEQILRLSKDENFSWACLIIESYLERPLKTAEVQLLTYLFDTLGFSKELLLYLYEYCCSLGKTSINYVQAVAFAWSEQNISTPEQAKEHSSIYSTAHTAIAKALALGRPLAKIECTYVERWQNQWHMDLAVIIEACNRTMLAIQKADFKYIEGILGKWQKENVHTLQDVQACDDAHKQKKAQKQPPASDKAVSAKRTQFQAFQQRDTSKEEIDELEKMLLTR